MKAKPNFIDENWRVEFDPDPSTGETTIMADMGKDYPVCIASITDTDHFDRDRAALMASSAELKDVLLHVWATAESENKAGTFEECWNVGLRAIVKAALDRALIADE